MLQLTLLVIFISRVVSHARWKCPLPRDLLDATGKHISFENTGNKIGPCGPITQWGYGTFTSINPGWNTLTFEESISHKGSPFRIVCKIFQNIFLFLINLKVTIWKALLDGEGNTLIVLLDHIPHNDAAAPFPNNETSYAPYKISVFVPDINCHKCSIQLLYVMTDKSTACGMNSCKYYPNNSACKGSTDPASKTCPGAPNSDVCGKAHTCFSNCKFKLAFWLFLKPPHS